jgi:hypothetical protein
MGYTHYWKIHKEIPLQLFKKIQTAAIAFAELSDTHLDISLNTHPLHLYLSIEGIDKEAHESFYLTPMAVKFDFCKTAMKPYDEVVVAVLNDAGRSEFFEWWSDGDKQDHYKGINLYGHEAIYTCSGREVRDDSIIRDRSFRRSD